jgi:L-ascorbate metabolism protein UlaG (beta-lactamase superfamily)
MSQAIGITPKMNEAQRLQQEDLELKVLFGIHYNKNSENS